MENLIAELPPEWEMSRLAAAQLQAEWLRLQSGLGGLRPEESFSQHSNLVASRILLVQQLSDDSELTLDPVLSSYYLMGAG